MKQLKNTTSATNYPVVYYGVIYALVLVLLLTVVSIAWQTNIPMAALTRDIAAIAGIHPFNGVISNIGILLWCAAASICLFSFAMLQNSNGNYRATRKKLGFFLLFSGLLTSFIMVDDLFMLHEEIFPSLNISEKAVYCGYMAIIFFYLLKFRKIIFKTEWVILCLGFLCFGASIIIDVFPMSGSKINLLEDGFKLIGIANWFAYFVRLCFQTLKNSINLDFNYDVKSNLYTQEIERDVSVG